MIFEKVKNRPITQLQLTELDNSWPRRSEVTAWRMFRWGVSSPEGLIPRRSQRYSYGRKRTRRHSHSDFEIRRPSFASCLTLTRSYVPRGWQIMKRRFHPIG